MHRYVPVSVEPDSVPLNIGHDAFSGNVTCAVSAVPLIVPRNVPAITPRVRQPAGHDSVPVTSAPVCVSVAAMGTGLPAKIWDVTSPVHVPAMLAGAVTEG